MSKRLTSKQEKFAQLVASGSNHSDAYREVYDVSEETTAPAIWQGAYALTTHAEVALRIEELRAITQKAAENELSWSTKDLVREARTNLDLSREHKQMGSANGALELIGRVTGLLSEKQQAATVTVTRITVVTTDSVTELREESSMQLQDVPALNVPENQEESGAEY